MPWVKFVKDHKQYKNGQEVDLPSYKESFRLKNLGILVRISPPASAVKRAVRKLVGRK